MSLSFRHAAFTVALLSVAFTVHAKTAGEIYEQAARSTVVVENINDKGEITGFGSGVVLPNGSVVTNCHVVKNASQLKVRSNKNKFPAVLQYSDLDRDVCSLFIVGLNAPAVVIGSTKMLKVGAKVFAIGAPKGFELTLSDGIVSSLREFEGGHIIQTNAAISPGSSGGGLFDENGALVGLTTFFFKEGQSLNFAVPVEWVEELAIRNLKAKLELAEKKRLKEQFLEAARAEQKAEEEQKAEAKKQALAEQKLLAEKEQAEQKDQVEQERARAVQKEVTEYSAKITAKIRRNIVLPPDIPYNVTTEFYVTLMPGGMVLKAELTKPSGSAAYDSAVERAIKKAQPLPLPPDITLFDIFRDLHLKFSPIVQYDRLPSCSGAYETATWTNCFGEYTYSSGAKYVGEFKDDKFNGQGTLTLTDGTKYSGEFKDDKFNGQEQDAKKKQVDNAIADHKANDFESGVKRAQPAAAQGDAQAQFDLGNKYYYGQGVTQDHVEALKWYRLAAVQGHATAQNNLGSMHKNGEGVAQDYSEALKWYRLSTVQGVDIAQFNLGVMYYYGQGVTEDYAEALKLYRLSAAQGNSSAQHLLGLMYNEGKVVTQDYVRAHMWLNLGAASGDADAVKNRDIVARKMTSQQIAQAQIMARDCQQKNFKGCE